MKESIRKFIRDVVFTTGLSFTLITFTFFLFTTLVTNPEDGGQQSAFYFFGYILGKLFCILLFSLSLGFINRLFDLKKSRALLRLIHFLAALAAYVLFMVVLFLNFHGDGLQTSQVLSNTVMFLVLYPLIVGINALARTIFLPKEKKKFKSILD